MQISNITPAENITANNTGEDASCNDIANINMASNIFMYFQLCFQNLLKQIFTSGKISVKENWQSTFANINAELPKNAEHGDIATNLAMVMFKFLEKGQFKNPREFANFLIADIQKLQYIAKAEVAGGGFINICLMDDVWHNILQEIASTKQDYGKNNIGQGQKVNVEYVSANPTGPLHIGHARCAVIGDVLARLLENSGYDVTKEHYVNDAGSQVEKLAKSLYIRYKQAIFGKNPACQNSASTENTDDTGSGAVEGSNAEGSDDLDIPEGLYPGEYLIKTAQDLKQQFGDKFLHQTEGEYLAFFKEYGVEAMMSLIKADLELLNVRHDVFTSEYKDIQAKHKVEQAIDLLQDKGLVYKGKLSKAKGGDGCGDKMEADSEPSDITDNEEAQHKDDDQDLVIFKSSLFGDDEDRALIKSEGTYTYFAPDIAYHYDKFSRGFKKMMLVLGADHIGYQKRLSSAVLAISEQQAELEIIFYNLVKLYEDGKIFKMSKRQGNFITAKQVIEQVSPEAVRFMMLTRKPMEVINFDVKKLQEQNKDNPIFYVQYASSRCHSILRNAKDEVPDIANTHHNLAIDGNIGQNNKKGNECKQDIYHYTSEEKSLIKLVAIYPKIIQLATKYAEPHRVVFYLIDLASKFHHFWSLGISNENLRFIIKDDASLTAKRLNMVYAIRQVLINGLDVVGIKAMEKM